MIELEEFPKILEKAKGFYTSSSNDVFIITVPNGFIFLYLVGFEVLYKYTFIFFCSLPLWHHSESF
jgi:hypothetical protein